MAFYTKSPPASNCGGALAARAARNAAFQAAWHRPPWSVTFGCWQLRRLFSWS